MRRSSPTRRYGAPAVAPLGASRIAAGLCLALGLLIPGHPPGHLRADPSAHPVAEAGEDLCRRLPRTGNACPERMRGEGIVTRALYDVFGQRYLSRCLSLFPIGMEYCDPPRPMPKAVRDQVDRSLSELAAIGREVRSADGRER